MVTAAGQQFDYEFETERLSSLQLGLKGAFQVNNAAIAISLFLLWLREARTDATGARVETAVRSGLREVRWPGRLELVQHEPLTVIDVGHTPDAIRQSLASLEAIYGAEGWVLVLGTSFDKKVAEIAGALAPSFDTIIGTAASYKGAAAGIIADAARQSNPSAAVHVAASIEEAVGLSQRLAASRNRKIYVAGGLFLAAEYVTVLRGGRAGDLKFF
jgi:dihydrofolate synthase/folylpolyglutamate synthase